MPDSLIVWLGQLQGGLMRGLTAELRAGGLSTAVFAFALGALHALTPGHGKAAMVAYFLGNEAKFGKGVRVALTAAMLHVLAGLAAFLVLRFVVGQVVSITGRASPNFAVFGYGLIVVAGLVMIVQSLRGTESHGDGAYALTAGIGLLPCPLTVTVLGFAWTQSHAGMVGLVLLALALGISLTIGIVAVASIVVRNVFGGALGNSLPRLASSARVLQCLAGFAIVGIGIATIASLYTR